MITEEMARKQLEILHQEGSALAKAFAEKKETEGFEVGYQRWYSRALPLLKELAPDRYAEFQRYYSRDSNADLHHCHDLVIQDYICELDSEHPIITREQAHRCFSVQLAILKSVADRLAWSQVSTDDQAERGMQLEMLESARGLLDIDERAAGVVTGTVLETWLRKLSARHKVTFRKQRPPLREYVDALHSAKVLDIPVHSQAVWLAELDRRSRTKGEPPTKLQVRDLIDGSRWLITNIF